MCNWYDKPFQQTFTMSQGLSKKAAAAQIPMIAASACLLL